MYDTQTTIVLGMLSGLVKPDDGAGRYQLRGRTVRWKWAVKISRLVGGGWRYVETDEEAAAWLRQYHGEAIGHVAEMD
jgi:hypothetical protein